MNKNVGDVACGVWDIVVTVFFSFEPFFFGCVAYAVSECIRRMAYGDFFAVVCWPSMTGWRA